MEYPASQLYVTLGISIAILGLAVSASKGKSADLIIFPAILVAVSWIHVFISFTVIPPLSNKINFLLHSTNLGFILVSFMILSSSFFERNYEEMGE